ncbi:hypothetical protein KI688_003408 [Linnemannia hyalina]|uniref:Uncharacterized protein n=1 Tax=Linnemannia hyalina TaxID=64524 RepID=A0A9P7XN10_9FUNG|nr:hypothetical protein KI688_003408 [Linnemannia hyalina]
MSTGAGIPSYQQACLAPDNYNPAVYLVGVASSNAGMLEVNYISLTNVNAPTSRPFGSNTNTPKWSAGAPKACFAAPSSNQANSVIKVVQFGRGTTYMSYISPEGVVADPTSFADLECQSPKLFGDDTSLFPSAVDPLLSVGTFTPTSTGNSRGYSVIFDKQGKGQVFSATGSDQATVNNTISVLVLSNPGSVNMNGIVLSSDAVSVTMGETGYILDKAKDTNATVLYSITPSISSTLQKVTNSGGAPAFFPSIAVTALNKQIVVYSAPPGGTPYFNSFDTTTGTWGGLNLITAPGPTPSGPPIGAIVGGVIGGLLVIALLIFLFIRRRNDHRRKAGAATIANANVDKYAPAPSTRGITQIHNGGVVVPVQGQIFQGQHQQQQQQQQQAGFNYQPPMADPYAQVQKPDKPLHVPYQPPTKFFDPYGGKQGNGVPVNYDTTGSQSNPTVYSASPIASTLPFRTESTPEHQQQQHYLPIQQQQQHQQWQHFLPEEPPAAIGVPISAASKNPQFIPESP